MITPGSEAASLLYLGNKLMKEETFYLVSPLILQFLYTYGRNEIYPYYEKAIYYGFPFIFNVSYHIKNI